MLKLRTLPTLFVFVVIMAMLIAACGGATQSPSSTEVAKASPTPITQSKYNPTAYSVTHGTPHLGGPLSDFTGKYGQPNDHSVQGQPHFLRDATSPADGLILAQYVDNTGYSQLIDSVLVQAVNGETWTITDAEAVCMAYAPNDAHMVKKVTILDTSGQVSGIDMVFMSIILAHTFPADAFTDVNQKPVRAGMFDVDYLYAGDGGQDISSCDMELGATQTQY